VKRPPWLDGWAAAAIAMALGLWASLAYLVPPLGLGIGLALVAFAAIDRTRNRWFRNAAEAAKSRRSGGAPWRAAFLETGDEGVVFLLFPGFSDVARLRTLPPSARVLALPGVEVEQVARLETPTKLGILQLRPHRGGAVGVWPIDRRVLVHPAATPADLAEIRPSQVLGAFAPMSEADLLALSRIMPELPGLLVLWWTALRPAVEARVLQDLGARVQIIEEDA
jgi:hypothetical protein